MGSINIEDLNLENVRVIADFGSESEDDDLERKPIEKEDEEIRDFLSCLKPLQHKSGNTMRQCELKNIWQHALRDICKLEVNCLNHLFYLWDELWPVLQAGG